MLLIFVASRSFRSSSLYCTYLLLVFPPAPANNSDESFGKNTVFASDNTFMTGLLEVVSIYAYVLYGESFVEISVRTRPLAFSDWIKYAADALASKSNLAFEDPWFLKVPSGFISDDELIKVWNFPLSKYDTLPGKL